MPRSSHVLTQNRLKEMKIEAANRSMTIQALYDEALDLYFSAPRSGGGSSTMSIQPALVGGTLDITKVRELLLSALELLGQTGEKGRSNRNARRSKTQRTAEEIIKASSSVVEGAEGLHKGKTRTKPTAENRGMK